MVKIGIVAPASRLHPETAERVTALARDVYGARAELVFHPQCFLSEGHFAGADAARLQAFLDTANDPDIDAVWLARGGYGSGRIAERAVEGLKPAAKAKTYLGYSDGGFLLAGLYARGYRVAHGPIPHDNRRDGGEAAVRRALAYLIDRDPESLEPAVNGAHPMAALNLTILSMLIGTTLMPDFGGHVLMLEEVSEHLYALDRLMVHITSHAPLRRVAGIRLGRVSEIPDNDPPFGQTPEQIVRHWCKTAGIAFLGSADIGHDAHNKVVPFGSPGDWR